MRHGTGIGVVSLCGIAACLLGTGLAPVGALIPAFAFAAIALSQATRRAERTVLVAPLS